MTQLRASIYGLMEPSRRVSARELWAEIAGNVAAEFSDDYLYDDDRGYGLVVRADPVLSPDKVIVRYRTIRASIRRRSGAPTLLDLSVGNLFSRTESPMPDPVQVVDDPRYAQWARHAGQVPLDAHAALIERFIADVQDAGWGLEQATLRPLRIAAPQVRNGAGVRALPTGKFHQMARAPAASPPADIGLVIVEPRLGFSPRAAWPIEQAIQSLFGQRGAWAPRITSANEPRVGAVSLIVLDDRSDLADEHDLREMLRHAESRGCGFKLAKASSIAKPYPAQNIAYDLFAIAGGRPWVPADAQPALCSLDAGHDKPGGRSRWVKVETDRQHAIVCVKVIDTQLAEHIPADVLPPLWPGDPGAILCRDGRMSKERALIETRAASEHRRLIEAKKSPTAILWRGSDSERSPALFGDAVVDEHGEVLIQTVPQDVRDYKHPVRLTVSGGDPVGMTTAFLHQQAVPGLSLFHMSRLPGALYFADLVSKLTSDGWPKAVGRGFRIPGIIP
jgi:hypothetical protein